MSQVPPAASSSSSPPSSNFQSAFNAALQAYENKTKNNLLTHPLADQLQSCDSPSAILSVLQDLIQQFDQRRRNDRRLSNWLNPTVNVVYALSATLSEGVGLVFSPAKVVFAGIGVLLLTAKDVGASQGGVRGRDYTFHGAIERFGDAKMVVYVRDLEYYPERGGHIIPC